MISKSSLRFNFHAFHLISLLGILPIRLDRKTGIIQMENRRWKNVIHKFYQLFCTTHFSLVIYRSVNAFVGESDENSALRVPLSVAGCICFTFFFMISCILFDMHPQINMKLFNDFTQGKALKKSFVSEERSKILLGCEDIQQLMLCFSGFLIHPTIFAVPLLYLADPGIPLLLGPLVDPKLESLWKLFPCMVAEMSAFLYYFATLNYTTFMIVSFVEAFCKLTLKEIEKIRCGTLPLEVRLEQARVSLNELGLRCSLFQLGFSLVVVIIKDLALVASIVGGFGIIHFGVAKPLYAVVHSIAFSIGSICFVAMFNNAFQTETFIEDFKTEILVQSQQLSLQDKRAEYKKEVKATPPTFVKVGRFGKMERESTPIFMDYISQQIASLLIAFQ